MNFSPANPYAPPRVRTGQLRVSLAILLGVLVAWTALVVSWVVPSSVSWPRAGLPLETAGVFVVSLLAALAYIRYSLTGAPSQLFVSLAFVALASTQLVLGVICIPAPSGSPLTRSSTCGCRDGCLPRCSFSQQRFRPASRSMTTLRNSESS